MEFNLHQKNSIKKILPYIGGMLKLQMAGQEVAIPFLQGPPGIGKTQMCKKHFIEKENMNFVDTHFGLTPYEDVSGLPNFDMSVYIDGEQVSTTKFTPPQLLSDSWKIRQKNDKPIIIFLDDFHLAPSLLKSLGYEMFTENKLRGYRFPDNCAFLLAGNFGQKAGAVTIPSPIVNRIARIQVGIFFEDWKRDYAIPNGINSKIINFLSKNHHLYFEEDEQINTPWASTRSWSYFSTLLNNLEKYDNNFNKNNNDIFFWAESHVGNNCASEFTKYYNIYSQFDLAYIFENNDISNLEIPNQLNELYILMLGSVNELVYRYQTSSSSEKQKDIHLFIQILQKVANISKEIAITGINEIIEIENAL